MALWRDPLDELIGELEKALPPDPALSDAQSLRMSFEELQFRVHDILYGRSDDRLTEAEAIAADDDRGTPGNDAGEEDDDDA